MTSPTVEPESSPAQAERYAHWLPALVALVAYVGSLRFGFVYDDRNQILLNPLIRSWDAVPLLFRTDVWAFWNPNVISNYWRPVFMLWFRLNYAAFGTHPLGWHLTTVLVHVAATWLTFRLFRRIGCDLMSAMIAALIFAVHPAHIETVAWISGVTDSLMSVLLIGAMLCFFRQREGARWWWMGASALLYFAALLTKETAFVLPVLVFAYVALWHRRGAEAVVAVIPYALVSAVYLILRRLVLHGVGHPYVNMSVWQLVLAWPSLLWFYARHLLAPVGLAVQYAVPPVLHADWQHFFAPALAVVALVAAISYWYWRTRERLVLFGALLVVLPILPVLYIPALAVDDFAHDRYLYLPVAGFGLLVALALRHVRAGTAKLFGQPAAQVGVAAIIVLALSAATSAQLIYWANDIVLFSRAITISPGAANAYNNLGTALYEKGRAKEAMFLFEQVLKSNRRSWVAQYNLGLGYFLQKEYAQAEEHLKEAVDISPFEGDAPGLLAETEIQLGNYAQAEQYARHAIEVKGFKPGLHRTLAAALAREGKTVEALAEAKTELANHPDDAAAQQLVAELTHKINSK